VTDKDCSHCDHVCQSTVDSAKLAEVHEWLAELMPVARKAVGMFGAREKLMNKWLMKK
jgi:hypothetical protein